VNALAKREIGDYLNDRFVSTYQKVGTFRIANGQKQGGNVASYFCTPDGGVLHAIAGPVDANTLLREARWVVETRKMALLESHGDLNKYKSFFRLAHANLIPTSGELAHVNWQRLPLYKPTTDALEAVLDKTPGAMQLDKQGRVHLLLAAFPLVKLDQAYKVVYDRIVGERVSTLPVAEGNAPSLGLAVESMASTNRETRARFDSPLLGRPTMPTPEELRAQAKARDLHHALTDAQATEIYSAAALNVLLADLFQRTREADSAAGGTRLAPGVLAHLNVSTVKEGGSFGLLRDGHKLDWPLPWHERPLERPSRELRDAVQKAIDVALAQGKKGRIHPETLVTLDENVRDLDELLARQVADIPAMKYIEAKRYLRQLGETVQVLTRKDADKYINGELALDPTKIRCVRELVDYMCENGLTFAAAVEGDEAAYLAVHEALAGYERSVPAELTAGDGAL
jgi:hypothetical protein